MVVEHRTRLTASLSLQTLLLCACPEQGLVARDEPKATVIGRALFEDGAPASDAWIYLARKGYASLRVEAEADGSFRFEEVYGGPAHVVVNDGNNHGALVELIISADGVNDAGTLVVGELDREPRLVDVYGVGYEERVLKLPRGYLVGFAPDATPLVGVLIDPAPQRRLGWIDVQARALVTAFDGHTYDAVFPLDERIVLARRLGDWFEVLDLETGGVLNQLSTFITEPPIWPTRDGVLTFASNGEPWLVLFDGSERRGMPSSLDLSRVKLLGTAPDRVIIASGALPFQVLAIELQTLEIREIVTLDGDPLDMSFALSHDGARLYVLGSDHRGSSRLEEIELATGATELLYGVVCGEFGNCLTGLVVDPESGELTFIERGSGAYLVGLDAEGNLRDHSAIYVDADSLASACFGATANACTVTSLGFRHQRLYTPLGAFNELHIDLFDGRIYRQLPLRLSDETPSDGIVAVPDTIYELVKTFDPESGFVQLFVGQIGRDLRTFRRLTHLRTDHLSPSVTPDGRYVYYWITDPVDGERSLYRIGLPR